MTGTAIPGLFVCLLVVVLLDRSAGWTYRYSFKENRNGTRIESYTIYSSFIIITDEVLNLCLSHAALEQTWSLVTLSFIVLCTLPNNN